ncbi:ABC transporter ATP-binding protein [Anaerorhabdus sp.]|uniref:ABC transporter ATP-binding protein n=1 Tax=Anaerorhabdus sp. TaxID=1872524 RepID=UPI002FCA0CE4
MLQVKHLSKSFGSDLVLDDCSFEIPKSRVVGLVGSNGAGKTTLLKCIQGVYDFSGEILFANEKIVENNKIKSKIFLVSDANWFPFNATMKSMEELYATFYHFNSIRYKKYVDIFNLDIHKKINEFSKGMTRLACVCFALAVEPELLLIDEVFDGLDPKVRQVFKRCIIEDMDETKMSVLVSSHALRELEDICDEFIFLNKTIYTQGNVQDLKQNYSKVQVISDDISRLIELIGDDKIVHRKTSGKVHILICNINKDIMFDIMEKIQPQFYECLPITFEEYYLLVDEGGNQNE